MRLRDRKMLADYMKASNFSQARLGRYAGCSRQFIHLLVSGEKASCTPEIGMRIEEALRVLPGTLFLPRESTVGRATRPPEARKRRVA